MDIGFTGIIFLWLALLWPIVAILIFVKSKSSYIKDNTTFFVVGFFLAYLFGYVFCFSIISLTIHLTEQIRNIFGLSDYYLSFLRYIPMAIIFAMPIAINYFVFFAFRKINFQRYQGNIK